MFSCDRSSRENASNLLISVLIPLVPFKGLIKINTLWSWNMTHVWTSALRDHFGHCFHVLKYRQCARLLECGVLGGTKSMEIKIPLLLLSCCSITDSMFDDCLLAQRVFFCLGCMGRLTALFEAKEVQHINN